MRCLFLPPLVHGLTVMLGSVFKLTLPENTTRVKIVEGNNCAKDQTEKLSPLACWSGTCQPSPISGPPKITSEGAVWYPMQISRQGAYGACVQGEMVLHIYVIGVDELREPYYCQVEEECIVTVFSGRGGLDKQDSLLVVPAGKMCGSLTEPVWIERSNDNHTAVYKSSLAMNVGAYDICYCEAKGFQPAIDCSVISNHFQRIGQLTVIGTDYLQAVCFRHEKECVLEIHGNHLHEDDKLVLSNSCPPMLSAFAPIGANAMKRDAADKALLEFRFPTTIFPAKFCYCSRTVHRCREPRNFVVPTAGVNLAGWDTPLNVKCQANRNCFITLPDDLHEVQISRDRCPPVNPLASSQSGATVIVAPLNPGFVDFEYTMCIRPLNRVPTWGFGGHIMVWSNIRAVTVRHEEKAVGVVVIVSVDMMTRATVRCGITEEGAHAPLDGACTFCVSAEMDGRNNIVTLPVRHGVVYCQQTSGNCTAEACTVFGPPLPLTQAESPEAALANLMVPMQRLVGQSLGLQLNAVVRLMDATCGRTTCSQAGITCIVREPGAYSVCACSHDEVCDKLQSVEYKGPRPVDLQHKPGDIALQLEGESLEMDDEVSVAPMNYECVNWVKASNFTRRLAGYFFSSVDSGEYTVCWRRVSHPYVEIGRLSVRYSQDCIVGQWTILPCTVPCGQGTSTRKREVLQPQLGFGNLCPSVFEEQACMMPECPKWETVIVDPATPTTKQSFTLTVPKDTELNVFFVLAGQPCEPFLTSELFVGASPCGPFSPRVAGLHRLCFCTEGCAMAFSAMPPLFVDIVEAASDEDDNDASESSSWAPLWVALGLMTALMGAVSIVVWRIRKGPWKGVKTAHKVLEEEEAEDDRHATVLDVAKSPSGHKGMSIPQGDVSEPDPEDGIGLGSKKPVHIPSKYCVHINPTADSDNGSCPPVSPSSSSADFRSGCATPALSSARGSHRSPGGNDNNRPAPALCFGHEDTTVTNVGSPTATTDDVAREERHERTAACEEVDTRRDRVTKDSVRGADEEDASIMSCSYDEIMCLPSEEAVAPAGDELVSASAKEPPVQADAAVATPEINPAFKEESSSVDMIATPNNEDRTSPLSAARREEDVAVPQVFFAPKTEDTMVSEHIAVCNEEDALVSKIIGVPNKADAMIPDTTGTLNAEDAEVPEVFGAPSEKQAATPEVLAASKAEDTMVPDIFAPASKKNAAVPKMFASSKEDGAVVSEIVAVPSKEDAAAPEFGAARKEEDDRVPKVISASTQEDAMASAQEDAMAPESTAAPIEDDATVLDPVTTTNENVASYSPSPKRESTEKLPMLDQVAPQRTHADDVNETESQAELPMNIQRDGTAQQTTDASHPHHPVPVIVSRRDLTAPGIDDAVSDRSLESIKPRGRIYQNDHGDHVSVEDGESCVSPTFYNAGLEAAGCRRNDEEVGAEMPVGGNEDAMSEKSIESVPEETMEERNAFLRRQSREDKSFLEHEMDETEATRRDKDSHALRRVSTGTLLNDGASLMLHLRRKSIKKNPA